MNPLIPRFIQQKYKSNHFSGSINCSSMFMDISGFTKMTESLMAQGKEGVEVLSSIINEVFSSVNIEIYEHQGFITGFAGDAMTALFPIENKIPALNTACKILDIFASKPIYNTKFGDYPLSVKVGLSYGNADWGIVGPDNHKSYFFRGAAIDGCAESEHHADKGQIIFDQSFADGLPLEDMDYEIIEENWYQYKSCSILNDERVELDLADIEEDTVLKFFPPQAAQFSSNGEFRQIASVFISFTGVNDYNGLNDFSSKVIGLADSFGAYFNLLDFGDKGGVMLLLFGAPTTMEQGLERAGDFLLSLHKEFESNIRSGFTYGTAYTGLVGSELRNTYTALGNILNLSARLMMKGEWGQCLLPETLAEKIKNQYTLDFTGTFPFKGFSSDIGVYSLKSKQEIHQQSYEGNFFGREKELNILTNASKSIHDKSSLVYIYGEAGIGKSRLLYEFLKQIENDYNIIQLQVDGILKKSLNPIISYFSQYFVVDNQEEHKTNFMNKMNDLYEDFIPIAENNLELKEAIEELKTRESILGSIIGLYWEDSLYEQLEPVMRFENLKYVLFYFFKIMSIDKPLIFIIEDIHWLDKDSDEVFSFLIKMLKLSKVLFIADSRYNDDGSKPIFSEMKNEIEIQEVELKGLDESENNLLVQTKIPGQLSESFSQFLMDRSNGNPLYTEQLSSYLFENQLYVDKDGFIELKEGDIEVPGTINEILISKVDRLEPEIKESVQIASILGREFEYKILEEWFPNNSNLLIQKGVEENIWMKKDEQTLMFKHALLMESVYNMQLKDSLRKLHQKAGELFEDIYKGLEIRYVDIAYHYDKAENEEKAIEYLWKGSDYSKKDYKNTRALEMYNKLESYTDEIEAISVQLKKTEILELLGKWDEGIAILYDCAKTTSEYNFVQLDAKVRSRLGLLYQLRSDYPKSIETLEEAIKKAGRVNDLETKSYSLIYLGRTLWSIGKYLESLKSLEEARDIKEYLGDKHGTALAIYYMGVAYRDMIEYKEALKCYKESLTMFKVIGNKRYIIYPLYDMGVLYRYNGDLKNAEIYFSESKNICSEIAYKSGESASLLSLASIEAYKGNFDDAFKLGNDALDIANEIGELLAVGYNIFTLGQIEYMEGHYDHAIEKCKAALALFERIGAEGYYVYSYSYIASSLIHLKLLDDSLGYIHLHCLQIKEGKSDFLHGRTYLNIALILSTRFGEISKPKSEKLLDDILNLNQIEKSAESYFELAVKKARKGDYPETLIPALAYYGCYLIEAQKSILKKLQGISELKEAYNLTMKNGMLVEAKWIKDMAEEILKSQPNLRSKLILA